MSVTKELFGTTKCGKQIYRYFISNSKGLKAGVINYGAILVNLFVPDKNGEIADVVLGYDTLEPYFENGSFFGATVGPNANRIGGASFVLDGQRYNLDVNDGKNNLHSHMELGYHKRVWEACEGTDSVTFSLEDEDGSMGFPGNKKISVTYTVTEDNELKLHYQGESDKNTILNMTNHTYFNLAGHNSGKIHDHKLQLMASTYTPVVAGAIPTGEIASVKGTPFDFLTDKQVGEEINADNIQLKLVQGYDHNWVIDGAAGTLREFATVTEETSGRVMKAYTDLPGVQFYAGNCISETVGKEGTVYGPRCGLCLETQYYPDTANRPEFPSAVFGPERKYDTTTIYKFI
ncbi:MAG: galactose mutarotase [Lachnospiraceae bacterium]|nr:galactose mutarotase [Lachnospiraceae bacterium]